MLQGVIETSPCGGWSLMTGVGNFVTGVSVNTNPF